VAKLIVSGVVFFEPTSILKSMRIIPSISEALSSNPNSPSAPIAFASPNILELRELWREVQSDSVDLTSSPTWWKTIDSFSLSSRFRMELDNLAKLPASPHSGKTTGTLSFLTEEGIAQMAINLLPFFQHLIIKCGGRGVIVVMRASRETKWASEKSNFHKRYLVSNGSGKGDIVVLQHFPANHLPPESIASVTGAGDTLVGSILASLVQNPSGFEDPKSFKTIIDDAQAAAVLTLQSEFAVSPSLSL
jgi:pseudouridine-5'-phosphate glycosidase/pseudouridine kinase